jgi:hypothetical protein
VYFRCKSPREISQHIDSAGTTSGSQHESALRQKESTVGVALRVKVLREMRIEPRQLALPFSCSMFAWFFLIALNQCQAYVVAKRIPVRKVLYGGEEHHERGLSGLLFGLRY